MKLNEIPDWVTFPEDEWVQITPEEAGLDPRKFSDFLGGLNLRGMNYGGIAHEGNDWGLVLTRADIWSTPGAAATTSTRPPPPARPSPTPCWA